MKLSDGIWKNEPCVIVGGGPSLKGFNWSQLEDYHTIAINRAYERFDPSIIIAADHRFYRDIWRRIFGLEVKKRFETLDCPKVVGAALKRFDGVYDRHGMLTYFMAAEPRLDDFAGKLTESLEDGLMRSTSTAVPALNLALNLGANPIYMLGFDMRPDGKGNTHFHDGYGKSTSRTFASQRCGLELVAAQACTRAQIINCSLSSALRCFEFGSLPEASKNWGRHSEYGHEEERMQVEVVVPSLNRPKELERLRESIPKGVLFSPSVEKEPRALTTAVNQLVNNSTGDIVVVLADHVVLENGCVENMVESFQMLFPSLDGMIGLNISNMPSLQGVREYCFFALGKEFLNRFPLGRIFCPDYYHFYGDTELGEYAVKENVFFFDEYAKVFTHHPNAGNAKRDATNKTSRILTHVDDSMRKKRQELGWLWGKSFDLVEGRYG